MKIFRRLYLHWVWNPKRWYWGKPHCFCGCWICDFGPLGIEYIPKGGECDLAMQEEDND